MKQLVKVHVFEEENSKNPIEICGRLLGVANIMEATKILQNPEVSNRVVTSETKSISDTIKAIESIDKENSIDALARLVIAIRTLKRSTDKEPLTTLSKKLFISAPISLISETVSAVEDAKVSVITKMTLECNDSSLLIVENMEE